MRIYLVGYPGNMGGANTEAWHTVKLWRRAGFEVHLVPTWGGDPKWKERLDAIGCVTHLTKPDQLESVPGLAGSVVVSFCNSEFFAVAPQLIALGCKLVWVNCMTFLFDREKRHYTEHGLFDAFVFQSDFQRHLLEPQLARYGDIASRGHLIRGAFDIAEWSCEPKPHRNGEPFIVGRVARPNADKWSSNTWRIYERIPHSGRRAVVMGVSEKTQAKLGKTPSWAKCLPPQALPVQDYLRELHCLLPVNGGARENWPRAGLEAMAAGVPIVAQNAWGWREMIEHGVTGFLGGSDEELAFHAAQLAYDEDLRLKIAHDARQRLVTEFACADTFASRWLAVFEQNSATRRAAA